MPERLDETRRLGNGHTEPSRGAPYEEGQSLAVGRAFVGAVRADVAALLRRVGRTLRSTAKGAQRPAPAHGRRSRGAVVRVVAGLAKMVVIVAVLGSLAAAGAMLWALHDFPPEKPVGGNNESSLILEAANGETLGRVGPLKLADAARTDVPNHLVKAVVSIEDRHFFDHPGFDPQGILRALQRDIAAGTIVEGGSTITQQLVKIRFLGHERTLLHKLREALTAVWLDTQLGKDEILTRYLNSVYLGNGAYGMSAGARLYFSKGLSELTLPEAAMLAGLIRSPSRDNPLQNLEAAQARAAVVIEAMRDNGAIDARTAADAAAQPALLHLSEQALPATTWFADWVAKDATEVIGKGNMRLRTTLMPALQKLAEQAIADVLAKDGAERRASQAALVAMRPDGAVVAMVGGRDYAASQFNRAVDAQRQPGSAFKLFVYFAALRKGLTPNDTIDASPVDIKGWHPENFDDRRYGRMALAEAFAKSINTAAARLAQQVGLNRVIAAARDLGVTAPLPAVPSLALGTADMNLLELTAAYAAVKAGEMPIKPWGVAGFGVGRQTRLRSMGPPIGGTQSLQPYQKPLLDLMVGVLRNGTGRAAALDGFAAGKTGTSQNYGDAWFIGFNDSLVAGVWVGNDDHTPMKRVTGGTLPAAIWKRFMTEAATAMTRTQPPAAEAKQPTVEASPQPSAEASSKQPASEVSPQQPATEASPKAGISSAQAPGNQAAGAPRCDFEACARTYQSFRASDCTYQPFSGGPRQLCEKNPSQQSAATPSTQDSSAQSLSGQPFGKEQCNIDVCARFYSSFDPADCTYRPFGGARRRVCTR
ncbi:MAG TPA: PBP1A family penicillin-binding protein [Xanthobacteraceae bacterium]|nr:PBP1A family penicillin-binding protein [Xanthobacteraceae bacterium]